MKARVAVLFARRDSVYKTIPGCDVYDIDRDARTYPGGLPVVAHPPCRSWGRFAWRARPAAGERELGPWAANQVRKWGGVLEHPAHSKLWAFAGLPQPGQVDRFGGWTLPLSQWWFGHPAEKRTWLYIVGVPPRAVPPVQMLLGEPSHVIASSRRDRGRRPIVSKRWREATPPDFGRWLCDLAQSARREAVAA